MSKVLVQLKAVLQTTPMRWNQLTQMFPEDLLRRQPLPGEWSALEVLQHLIDTDKLIFPVRVKAILAGEESFPGFFPDEQGSKASHDITPMQLAQEFEALRIENLKLVKTIQADDLPKQARHAELGVVTLEELLFEWGGHDLMHLVQAEQAMMQPFIQGCPPWESYFALHKATAKS